MSYCCLVVRTWQAVPVLGDDHGTFDTFYQKNIGVWGWIGIGAAVVIGVVVAIYTLGSGVPAWCAAVGTWIGGTLGLSGAAATSAGLALLGGGSLAVGGWGMAGGVAVLVAAATFSGEVIVGYSIEKAINAYSDRQFAKDCRLMLHLPMPVNTKGGNAYQAAQHDIEGKIKTDKPISEGDNQQVIRDAIEKLIAATSEETNPMRKMKDETMLALLYWVTGKPDKASERATSAIQIADKWNEEKWLHNFAATPTIAKFIRAVNQLERGETDSTFADFEYAILQEPGNKLIPLLFGIYLDRLMELYHYDQVGVDHLRRVAIIANDPTIERHSPTIAVMLMGRLSVEIKRCQQDIFVVTQSIDDAVKNNERVNEKLQSTLDRYKELIRLGNDQIIPMLAKHDHDIPKDVLKELPYRYTDATALLNAYIGHAGDLKKMIVEFSERNSIVDGEGAANDRAFGKDINGFIIATIWGCIFLAFFYYVYHVVRVPPKQDDESCRR